jgi:hypothetical protein
MEKNMRRFIQSLGLCALIAGGAQAAPDLSASVYASLLSSADPVVDTVVVTSTVFNNGTSDAVNANGPLKYLDVVVDGLSVASHSVPQNTPITVSDFLQHFDTVVVIKSAFSLMAWADPERVSGEEAGSFADNLTSLAYSFHAIVVDTVYIDSCPPTGIRPFAGAARPGRGVAVPSKVYNAVGQVVWQGRAPQGVLPAESLRPGLYLLVQGAKTRHFRVMRK